MTRSPICQPIGGEQAVARSDRLRAGVHQQEAAGAVGVLRHARLEAALPEGRGLLVAGHTGDRDRRAEQLGIGLAQHAARRLHLGQHRARHVEDLEQLVVPVEPVDVEQQRAARVRHVGGVDAAAGQPPQQEAVDGAGEDLAVAGARAQPLVAVEQMLDLGAGEVGVDHQAGLLLEQRLQTVGLQSIADRSGDAALPHDRVRHRTSGRALPQHDRLALIGDADRGDVVAPGLGLAQHLPRRAQLRAPDRLRVVLDVAGRRVELRELLLGGRLHRAGMIEQDRAAGRGALVESEDVSRHESLLSEVAGAVGGRPVTSCWKRSGTRARRRRRPRSVPGSGPGRIPSRSRPCWEWAGRRERCVGRGRARD